MLHRALVLVSLTLAVAALLGACRSEPSATDPSDSSAEVQTSRVQTFGQEISTDEAVPVETLADDPAAHDGRTVTVSGRITQVCQKKGCWLALDAGDTRPVRVMVPRTDSGYAFTVPLDAEGEATVQGTVRLRPLSNEERDHYAGDGAERPDTLDVQIAAAGIALAASTP
jgi:hypothetical protein